MSAFKKLNRKDSYTTVHNSKKKWAVRETDFESLGIKLYDTTQDLEYLNQSIKHLYFSQNNPNSSVSSSFENYLQSSFDGIDNRDYAEQDYLVLSISSRLFGTHIEPGTFRFKLNPDKAYSEYTDTSEGKYIEQDLTLNDDTLIYTPPSDLNASVTITEGTITFPIETLIDDQEGNLIIRSGNYDKRIGNIIYTHGIIIITNLEVISAIREEDLFETVFKSNLPIYIKNYHCRIKNSELNHSLNPSIYNKENGKVNTNIENDNFSPYFTTIGLYNDNNELIAVAKTSQPIPKSRETDTTVNIKLDSSFRSW